MFLNFYGLREQPFGVTPDPRFLYLSPAHREALASIYYGIDAGRGFVALIAKPGMGKTTLLFHLLQRFGTSARTVFLFQTQCNSREFMRFLLLELGCELQDQQDLVTMHEEFNRCLLQEARAGRRFIVVVDEAQNLEPSVLETVRLLSDFETPQAKLLQIVLSGQPELADKLDRPSLRQLRQRVSLLSTLTPLSHGEVERYINHRLLAAGRPHGLLFTARALEMITELSNGIPRTINNICFNALSLGCSLRRKTIDVDIDRLPSQRASQRQRIEANVIYGAWNSVAQLRDHFQRSSGEQKAMRTPGGQQPVIYVTLDFSVGQRRERA